mgnify:CR=1 FL=1
MDTLKELSERIDRIKVLMDYKQLNIEEMLAGYAETHVKCSDCPIPDRCGESKCYDVWLKYFNNER